jgi:hypothetical protein
VIRRVAPLVHAWLILDFFGDSRRREQGGSTLTSTIFTQSFIALLLAAVLFDADAQPVSYAAANLSLSTLLVGLGTLADPQRADRRAADRVLTGTSPLPRVAVPLARLAYAAFQLVLVTTGMAIPAAILLFWVAQKQLWIVPCYVAVASLTAGLLAGALALALRALTRWYGASIAALLAGSLKAILLGSGFLGFALYLPHVSGTLADLPLGALIAVAWPPYHAARWLAAPVEGIAFLGVLVGAGVVLFAATVLVGDEARSHAAPLSRRRSLSTRLEQRIAANAPVRGATAFIAAMLFRSPGFRARVLPLFGMPLAMVLLAFWQQDARERQLLIGVTLQLPAMYLPFLVMFLPFAEHQGSAWLFRTSPHDSIRLARQASLIAVAIRILLPIHAVALPVMVVGGRDVAVAASLSVFSWGIAVLLAELALRRLDCMPFTSQDADDPGVDFGGMLGLALVLTAGGAGFALVAGSAPGLGLAALAGGAAGARLRRAGRGDHA